MLLGRGRKVVATEQADGHVVEHHGPEREAGAVRPGGVGGDDGLVLGYGGVEVDVVGERDLDDPVNAVGCVCPDGAGRIGLVEGDGVRDGGGVHLLQIAALAHRPDDSRPAPVRELGGHGPDTAKYALHEDRQAGDWAIGENGPVGSDPGDTQTSTDLVTNAVWKFDGLLCGNDIADPSQPRRFFVSPGFTPERVTRTRTSPGPGSGSGSSPAWRTSPAGPCRSYQTARTNSYPPRRARRPRSAK